MNKRFCLTLAVASAVAVSSLSVPAAWAQAAPAPSAKALDLTRQYLELIEINAMMGKITQSLGDNILPPAGQNGMTPEIRAAVKEAMSESMAVQFPKMMEKMSVVYAQTLSETELQALVDFYGSPTGRSITAKANVLAGTSGQVMNEFAPAFQKDMLTRLCAKVECPASMKAALAKP